MATSFETVDDYLAAQPPLVRAVLARLRATVLRALPGATEGISYRIPVYKVGGRMVLYIAGYPRHYSIYPATKRVLAELGRELEGRVHSKATIRFSYEEPFPARLVTRVAKARAAEAAEASAAPKKAKNGTRRSPTKTAKKKTARAR